MFDWKTNALFWLRNYLDDSVIFKIDTRNMNENRKDTVLSDKVRKLVENGDLCSVIDVFPSELKVWSPDHKNAVLDYMMKICLGQNFPMSENEKRNTFKFHLWLLASLLNDFDERGLLESSDIAQVFNEIFQLFKTHFALNFPEETNRLHKAKSETQLTRPVCRECGSIEVNSYGLRWHC